MQAMRWQVCALAVVVVRGTALGQELYKATTGPFSVSQKDCDWRDEARQRDVPVRVYLPQEKGTGKDGAVEKRPLIVFSHGLGASRTSYSYICEHLASHGYVVIVPTHQGSDTASVRDAIGGRLRARPKDGGEKESGLIAENTGNPDNLRNRPMDIAFVIDQAGRDAGLSKQVDLGQVGVAGHSFGAYTAMAEGGMLVDLPDRKGQTLRDSRVKAVLPMSPEGHGIMGIDAGAWDTFAVPVLFLTGTRDYGQGARSAAWRREAFDAIRKKGMTTDAYLIVLKDATHMTFGGGDRLNPEHAHHQELIKAITTAWFDAQLKDDPQAAAWLKAFAAATHDDCTAEMAPGGRGADRK
jgi:predicted dienelactone hydrolase